MLTFDIPYQDIEIDTNGIAYRAYKVLLIGIRLQFIIAIEENIRQHREVCHLLYSR